MAEEEKEKLTFFNVRTKKKEATSDWTEEIKNGHRMARAKGKDGTKMTRFLPNPGHRA